MALLHFLIHMVTHALGIPQVSVTLHSFKPPSIFPGVGGHFHCLATSLIVTHTCLFPSPFGGHRGPSTWRSLGGDLSFREELSEPQDSRAYELTIQVGGQGGGRHLLWA